MESLSSNSLPSIAFPRSNSVPNFFHTGLIHEAEMLQDDLNELTNIPNEDISLQFIESFKLQQDKEQRNNNSTLQPSLIKHQKAEVKEDNLSEQKFKSNASNTPMRCNYLLKSDVCKSSSRSNFYYSHQEESPMLNYYGGVPTLTKRPSVNNDYMLFVKKPKRDDEIDFNTANYFAKNPTSKKEIMISRYTEDDELVEYINSPTNVHEEEEAVTVELPMNLKINNGKNAGKYQNANANANVNLCDSGALLFKQSHSINLSHSQSNQSPVVIPNERPQQQTIQLQQEFSPQKKPVLVPQDNVNALQSQKSIYSQEQQQHSGSGSPQKFNQQIPLTNQLFHQHPHQQQQKPLQQTLPLQQQQQQQRQISKEKALGTEPINIKQPQSQPQPQPINNNINMIDPYMLNNYMYVNFLTNQNMILQMAGNNNGMNQYYQLPPVNNYSFQNYPMMNGMPYPMMKMNPQMQQAQAQAQLQSQQPPFNMKLNQPIQQPQSQMNNPINNPQYNIKPNHPIMNNNSNINVNGGNMGNYNNNSNSNYNKRQPKQQSLSNNNNNNSNYANYSDDSLAQLSPFLIKEQSGCRYIQDKVNSDPQFANNTLFPHLKEEITDLICDPFGNYLFQVLIDVLYPENLESLLTLTTNSFYQICISPHGTRVVQKIIDKLPSSLTLLQLFNKLISYQLIDTCKDPYGNHIIQKYLSVVSYPHNQFIYNCIQAHFIDIANSKHGCCVVQKGISEGNEEQRQFVLDLIHKHLFDLITDQFGNYTIQYIFLSQNNYDIEPIIVSVLDNIVYLCMQKYSSNVLEKCFENSNKEIQKRLIRELVRSDNVVSELISDSYGNYVIQKALLVNKDENYFRMLNVIAGSIGKIKKQSFGSKLIAKLLVTHKELGNLITSCKKDKEMNSGNIGYKGYKGFDNSNSIVNSNYNGDNDNGFYIPDNGSAINSNTNSNSNNYNQGNSNVNSNFGYYSSHSNYNNNNNGYKKKSKDKGNGYKR